MEILTHATHVNGWEPAVYMSCMSQNFHLFTCLHELHESKFPFVTRIEFIRSKLSIFSARVSGVRGSAAPDRDVPGIHTARDSSPDGPLNGDTTESFQNCYSSILQAAKLKCKCCNTHVRVDGFNLIYISRHVCMSHETEMIVNVLNNTEALV